MQTIYWIGINVILLLITIILVPMERIKKLFSFGLIGGIGMAIIIFYLFSNVLGLWETIGSSKIMGIDILPIIAWFFTTVIFGNFFPENYSLISKILYVLLFATGAIVANYILIQLKMWRNIHWNYLYTFLLAFIAHIILSLYIMKTEHYLPEK